MSKKKTVAHKAALYIVRKFSGEQGTLSEVYVEDPYEPGKFAGKGARKICYALERPWADNKKNVSCIPDGSYPLLYRKTGRYYEAYKKDGHEFVLEVGRVPDGRFAILIHKFNWPLVESRGCFGPCTTWKASKVHPKLKGQPQFFGVSSGVAYEKLMKWVYKHRPSHIVISGLDNALLGWLEKD